MLTSAHITCHELLPKRFYFPTRTVLDFTSAIKKLRLMIGMHETATELGRPGLSACSDINSACRRRYAQSHDAGSTEINDTCSAEADAPASR